METSLIYIVRYLLGRGLNSLIYIVRYLWGRGQADRIKAV